MVRFLGLVMTLCAVGVAARVLRPATAKAALAISGPAADIVYATGSIELDNRIHLRARTAGTVKDLLVREGETVRAGAVLARLESPRVTAKATKTQSLVATAKSKVRRAGAGGSNTAAVRAEIAQAQAELASTRKLVEFGTLAPIEAERARLRLDVLNARLTSSLSSKGAASADAREAETQAEADSRAAEAEVADLEIRAPFDALVLESSAHVGDVIEGGYSAFTIARAGAYVVTLTVDEVAMGRVQARSGQTAGSPANVTVYALDRRVLTGEVIEVSPEVDRGNRTFRAKVRIEGDTRDLRSGMTAEANIVVRQHQATLVPSESVENNAVWVVTEPSSVLGAKVVRRAVAVGIRDLLQTEIATGLRPGEQVVVSATSSLREGTRVRIQ